MLHITLYTHTFHCDQSTAWDLWSVCSGPAAAMQKLHSGHAAAKVAGTGAEPKGVVKYAHCFSVRT